MRKALYICWVIAIILGVAACAVTTPNGKYELEIDPETAPIIIGAGASVIRVAGLLEQSGLITIMNRSGNTEYLYAQKDGQKIYRFTFRKDKLVKVENLRPKPVKIEGG